MKIKLILQLMIFIFIFNNVLANNNIPSTNNSNFANGMKALRLKEFKKAETCFTDDVNSNKESRNELLKKGRQIVDVINNKLKKELTSEYLIKYYNLAFLYYKKGNSQNSCSKLEYLISQEKKKLFLEKSNQLFSTGIKALQNNNYKKATTCFEKDSKQIISRKSKSNILERHELSNLLDKRIEKITSLVKDDLIRKYPINELHRINNLSLLYAQKTRLKYIQRKVLEENFNISIEKSNLIFSDGIKAFESGEYEKSKKFFEKDSTLIANMLNREEDSYTKKKLERLLKQRGNKIEEIVDKKLIKEYKSESMIKYRDLALLYYKKGNYHELYKGVYLSLFTLGIKYLEEGNYEEAKIIFDIDLNSILSKLEVLKESQQVDKTFFVELLKNNGDNLYYSGHYKSYDKFGQPLEYKSIKDIKQLTYYYKFSLLYLTAIPNKSKSENKLIYDIKQNLKSIESYENGSIAIDIKSLVNSLIIDAKNGKTNLVTDNFNTALSKIENRKTNLATDNFNTAISKQKNRRLLTQFAKDLEVALSKNKNELSMDSNILLTECLIELNKKTGKECENWMLKDKIEYIIKESELRQKWEPFNKIIEELKSDNYKKALEKFSNNAIKNKNDTSYLHDAFKKIDDFLDVNQNLSTDKQLICLKAALIYLEEDSSSTSNQYWKTEIKLKIDEIENTQDKKNNPNDYPYSICKWGSSKEYCKYIFEKKLKLGCVEIENTKLNINPKNSSVTFEFLDNKLVSVKIIFDKKIDYISLISKLKTKYKKDFDSKKDFTKTNEMIVFPIVKDMYDKINFNLAIGNLNIGITSINIEANYNLVEYKLYEAPNNVQISYYNDITISKRKNYTGSDIQLNNDEMAKLSEKDKKNLKNFYNKLYEEVDEKAKNYNNNGSRDYEALYNMFGIPQSKEVQVCITNNELYKKLKIKVTEREQIAIHKEQERLKREANEKQEKDLSDTLDF